MITETTVVHSDAIYPMVILEHELGCGNCKFHTTEEPEWTWEEDDSKTTDDFEKYWDERVKETIHTCDVISKKFKSTKSLYPEKPPKWCPIMKEGIKND
jgi:hypothetical protein